MRWRARLSAVAVAAAVAPLSTSEGSLKTLLPGEPQNGRLTAGASQTYVVKAAKGQLLQVRVEQDRLPLALRWSMLGGKTIAESQNYTSDDQPMVLSVVTGAEGAYSIELKLPSAPAPADYRIELSAKPAREADSNEIRGEAAYNEGRALLSLAGADNARKAIAKFEEASALWRMNSLEGRVALAELQLSEAYFMTGDAQKSLEWSTSALRSIAHSKIPRALLGR